MKTALRSESIIVLRFDSGEEVITELMAFCESEKITAASFTGIGSTTAITLSWYNSQDKTHISHAHTDKMEIVSLIGTVALESNKICVHAHGSFSDYELNVRGGHVKRITVSASCEVTLQILPGTLTRAHDSKWDLDLLT